MRRRVVIDPDQRRAEGLVRRVRIKNRTNLTPREKEVMLCLERGDSINRAAKWLGVRPGSVHTSLTVVADKLGCDRGQASAVARERGLLPDPLPPVIEQKLDLRVEEVEES